MDFQQKENFFQKMSIFKRATLFTGIDDGEINAMLKCLEAKTVVYQKNEYILRVGDSPKSLGLLVSGSLLIIQEDFSGNRNIRARISPGQVFAETFACLPGAVMDISVIADEESSVVWLNIQHILHTCPTACEHHVRIIRNLLSDLAANSLRANEKLTHISKRTTRDKLLSYLSSESRRQGRATFTIPFNRQELADYLSVERSAMSTELSKMQKDGLITVEKNRFTLK